ncbi:MAG: DUF4112 domain-containing protein [Pseudomonadota bacterium]
MDPASASNAKTLGRLKRFATLLDSAITLPGGFRIGVSGFIGMIPGLGDVIASALTASIILSAVRLRPPVSVMVRMLLNMAIDFVIGIVPLVGDLADFAFKANDRNVRLLEAYLAAPGKTTTHSRWLLFAIVFAVLAMLGAAVVIGIVVARYAWSLLAG